MIYLYYLFQRNEVMYVGLTVDPCKRKRSHRTTRGPHTFCIIDEFSSIKKAAGAEIAHIAEHKTYRNLHKWNKSPGGEYMSNTGYSHKGIGGASKGRVPWNKGLSAADPRVKRNGQLTKKARIKNNTYIPWNKGLPNPQGAINGKKGAAKQSQTITGRKLATRPDGTRYWVYPKQPD